LPSAPSPASIHGGIDIRDAHNGQLRLRVYLPEPFAMLNTDVDGLNGGFLANDENGQRLFALTTSGLTIIQLASVPLGIGTISPAAGSAARGVIVTLRGSGLVNGTKVTLGGKIRERNLERHVEGSGFAIGIAEDETLQPLRSSRRCKCEGVHAPSWRSNSSPNRRLALQDAPCNVPRSGSPGGARNLSEPHRPSPYACPVLTIQCYRSSNKAPHTRNREKKHS
jgi:hypothetical protein